MKEIGGLSMDFLVGLADKFNGLFQAGADQFVSFLSGMLPLIACLILFVNALIKFVGEDRVFGFMKKMTRFTILRYTVIPFLACFFLTNPMCYTFGTFLEEKYKAGFYDATVSMLHPITGLFPHANSSELFVWLGISAGYTTVGNTNNLAIRFLLTGFLVCLIRGVVTEQLAKRFTAKRDAKTVNA